MLHHGGIVGDPIQTELLREHLNAPPLADALRDCPEQVRVLLVDDFAPWRRAVSSMLLAKPELQVIGEASDGPEAVEKAFALKPHLILLDIGLPTLNGIEAARQIRQLAPESQIIFLSQESSEDVMQEALSTGASGYVVKSRAGRDLLSTLTANLSE